LPLKRVKSILAGFKGDFYSLLKRVLGYMKGLVGEHIKDNYLEVLKFEYTSHCEE